jgi:hypothetical protein
MEPPCERCMKVEEECWRKVQGPDASGVLNGRLGVAWWV